MKILSFDSTAKAASAAVLENDKVLSSFTIDNGVTQSELLLPMAEDMLKNLKLTFRDIELYACSVGPGSFTGVRIGTALVKGLAFGRNIPCVGVSTLEGLAENLAGMRDLIVPVMDARRGQYYTAIFSYESQMTRLTEDEALSAEALGQKLCELGKGKKIYLVGDGYNSAKAALDKLGVYTEDTPPLLILENAASVGAVAYRKYISGDFCSDTDLKPTYLRLPQAERERLERLSKEK